ncbi:ATP-binding protein [Paenibacillus sp. GCM10027626]|uniref:HAMP domain-containing sensor histidine kinase n=1 Tax=Paenibacillus sp. GCM10027626 TaxID=3273411 RepID=UPI00363C3701
MIDKLWSFLNARKSIRGKVLWAIVPSLFLATVTSSVFDNYVMTLMPVMGEITEKIVSFGFFIAAFVFFFLILTRQIVRYLKTIIGGLQLIAEGNLDHRIPQQRKDELGDVAENINHMAERLQSQLQRERLLEKSKMELITSISHDLRTPLTSIIGYLNLLKMHSFESEQEKERYIDNAFQKTEQLKKRIDDLFEYTRLANGDVRLMRMQVDLLNLLEQIITEFEPVAKERGLSIAHNIAEQKSLSGAPVMVDIDIEMIVRAIDNLLMNALKFSINPGTVQVKLSIHEHHAVLSVENEGQPISKETETQLFERFYKGEVSRYDRNMPGGSGLGLSIARNIAELHGGRLWLEHRAGHYRFMLELSLAVPTD